MKNLYAMIVLTLVTSVSHAQPPKEVVVINEPLIVEVVNPALPSAPVRWQLVGFTSATYTGDMGGVFGATQKCQLEFPNSRVCSIEEVGATTSIPPTLTGEAWINRGCGGWTTTFVGNGSEVVTTIGEEVYANDRCSTAHSIACCAQVP